MEKSINEKVAISVEILNFLSEKNCTIDEAMEILNRAGKTITQTSTVQKFNWVPNPEQTEFY